MKLTFRTAKPAASFIFWTTAASAALDAARRERDMSQQFADPETRRLAREWMRESALRWRSNITHAWDAATDANNQYA